MNTADQKKNKVNLTRSFWLLAILIYTVPWINLETDQLSNVLGFMGIAAVALVPSWLWVRCKAFGLPVFPVFTLSLVWAFAFPLLGGNDDVMSYGGAAVARASFTVIVFIVLATFVWIRYVGKELPEPAKYLAFRSKGVNGILMAITTMALFLSTSINAGAFVYGGVFAALTPFLSIIRTIIYSLTVLASFVLSFGIGEGRVKGFSKIYFCVVFVAYVLTKMAGLQLVGGASLWIVATMGYILGRRKIPYVILAIGLTVLTFLHWGKASMRNLHSGEIIPISSYGEYYAEWIGYSLNPRVINKEYIEVDTEKSSLLTRTSIMQHLLRAQSMAPHQVPFLYGATYKSVPLAFIPRVLYSGKVHSHAGTSMLNIHFGVQSEEETLKTTVGWGLINESWANFGLFGVMMLAIIMGILLGKVTAWSMNASVLSFRFLATIIVISFSFNTELPLSAYIPALWQSMFSLSLVAVLFMKAKYRTQSIHYDQDHSEGLYREVNSSQHSLQPVAGDMR